MNKCSCGFDPNPDLNLIDSLYPTNREGTEWNFHCGVHNGALCDWDQYRNDLAERNELKLTNQTLDSKWEEIQNVANRQN